ncbi:MAG: tetratricopeptide repeat protein [Calditrichota bacterium]
MRTIRIIYRALVLLGFLFLPLSAQSGSDYFFEQGNTAYRANDFAKALEWYNKILDTGYTGSALYYNIGNCYFKLEQVGPSILFYEKALRLAPGDEEIRFNLDLANSKVIDRIQQPPKLFIYRWWDSLVDAFSLGQLTWITAILFFLLIAFYAVKLLLVDQLPESLIRYGLIALLVLTLFSVLLLFSGANHYGSERDAIVLVPRVNVLSAPGEQGNEVFVLHEGVKVWRSEQRGDWVRIELPDGKTGWIEADKIGVVAG